MKVLHITPWYPHPQNLREAIWIERHISALEKYCQNEIWHITTVKDTSWSFYRQRQRNVFRWRIGLPTNKSILLEIVTFLQLVWLGTSKRDSIKNADVIIFHIAYPSLVFWSLLKRLYNKTSIISEHWSAYHFNFDVKKTLPRIQRIFRHGLPVIAVSNALVNDIRSFSKAQFPSYIIPNIVTDVFVPDTSKKREPFFFMVSQWKSPKDPFPLFSAFRCFNDLIGYRYQLLVGGYGPQYDDMLAWKKMYDNSDSIRFLGIMDEQQIADKMQRCSAFLHPTRYETFSVVCAEAVSCGAFVVAPNVGGISEVIDDSGLLLDAWTEEDWLKAFKQIANNFQSRTTKTNQFTSDAVGKRYMEVFKQIRRVGG